jgi:hypothetical protein
MLPWLVLEWDPSHLIFLGVFYAAITAIGLGLFFVGAKTIWDYFKKRDH